VSLFVPLAQRELEAHVEEVASRECVRPLGPGSVRGEYESASGRAESCAADRIREQRNKKK
jgi:hypothetical protein